MKVRALPSPPPFALRLAAASFYIFMRMTLGGEGVKPEEKTRRNDGNANFPHSGKREKGTKWSKGASPDSVAYYVHLRAQKRRTMCLRNGQLRPRQQPVFNLEREGYAEVDSEFGGKVDDFALESLYFACFLDLFLVSNF